MPIFNALGKRLKYKGSIRDQVNRVRSMTFPCYAMSGKTLLAYNTCNEDVSGYSMGKILALRGVNYRAGTFAAINVHNI